MEWNNPISVYNWRGEIVKCIENMGVLFNRELIIS